MSVKYSVSKRFNPSKPQFPMRYYASAQAYGDIPFNVLCEDVSKRCTATKADISASIEGALVTIEQNLREGKVVRFGEFGSFQVALRSKGADTEKDFSVSLIKGGRILFRPGKLLTDMLKTLEYKQVPHIPVKPKKTKTEGEGGKKSEVIEVKPDVNAGK